MTDLAETVGNRDQCSLLTPRCRDYGCLPGELQVQAVVRARDEQEEAKVSGTDVGRRDQHGTTNGAADYGQDDVPKGLLTPTRRPGNDACKSVGKGVRRCLDEVGCELTKVECVDNLVILMLEFATIFPARERIGWK